MTIEYENEFDDLDTMADPELYLDDDEVSPLEAGFMSGFTAAA